MGKGGRDPRSVGVHEGGLIISDVPARRAHCRARPQSRPAGRPATATAARHRVCSTSQPAPASVRMSVILAGCTFVSYYFFSAYSLDDVSSYAPNSYFFNCQFITFHSIVHSSAALPPPPPPMYALPSFSLLVQMSYCRPPPAADPFPRCGPHPLPHGSAGIKLRPRDFLLAN